MVHSQGGQGVSHWQVRRPSAFSGRDLADTSVWGSGLQTLPEQSSVG